MQEVGVLCFIIWGVFTQPPSSLPEVTIVKCQKAPRVSMAAALPSPMVGLITMQIHSFSFS